MSEEENERTFALPGWHALLPWAALIAVGLLSYANSFSGEFVFDDTKLTDDYSIRRVWPPWYSMFSETNLPRPVVGLSLAVNYAISGLDLWSYHAFNLSVHLLAAATLYSVVRRTLLTEPLRARFGDRVTPVALSVALLWLVHPVQTQSVTYIIQRAEAMGGLFFLLTLYCVIRGAGSEASSRWYGAAIAACALGMASKPVMATAPIIVFIYCSTFLTGSARRELNLRWPLYAGLASTWVILAATLYFSRNTMESAGFGLAGITVWGYLRSQPAVIVHYLWLAAWPTSLCLDYGWPVAKTTGEVLPYALLVAGLGFATLFALFRRAPLGFLGVWFFLILAPTSSFMPIADLAVEHRMYLPLAAVCTLAVVGAYRLTSWLLARLSSEQSRRLIRLACVGSAVVAVAWLGSLTVRRNADYHDRVLMWRDVVAKRPENPRGHSNLGLYLLEIGKPDEAIQQLNEALRLNPNFAEAQSNLGVALANTGRMEQAIPLFTSALSIRPNLKIANYNLGQVFASKGDFEQAALYYQEEIRINPKSPGAHLRLGFALESRGRLVEAVDEYRTTVELMPDWPEALRSLSLALIRIRQRPEDLHDALILAQRAVDLTARQDPIALDILGVAYAANGRLGEATRVAELARKLASDMGDSELADSIQVRLEKYKEGPGN